VTSPTGATHGDGTLTAPHGAGLIPATTLPAGTRVAVVASRYHSLVLQTLLDGAVAEARSRGVGDEAIDVIPVPGAFELPLAARAAAASGRYAAVVALGCVIRGDTPHFDYVCSEAARGILLASLETGVPIGFGVITVDNAAQAWERAGGAAGNKGAEAAGAALELAGVLATVAQPG
jgi:6,7-dimethyl-8-ribityllumazine synthase